MGANLGKACRLATRAPRGEGLFTLLLVLALVGSGCRGLRPDPLRSAARCERAQPSGFVVGANVIDLPDDRDEDPGNDGQRGYGSDKARATLDRLASLGLDGVVLPVPLLAADVSATKVRGGWLSSPAGQERLGRMIDDAHARGLAVVVVAHLGLDDGGWRGDLVPRAQGLDEREAIARFFSSYEDALRPIARVAEAHCAEALSVAVELKALTKRPSADAPLAALVASVRERFSGEVLYSANWDEVSTVRRWALFDRIGVQAFAPLAADAGADDEELLAGARAFQAELAALSVRSGRPVWLVEAGFKAISGTFVEPWRWPDEVNAKALPVDETEQARAYRALTTALRGAGAVDGVFFWAVPSDLEDRAHAWAFEPPQGFSFVGKQAEEVVKELARARPARAD